MPEFAFAWLDCEFGGLNPREHDITEVAVIVTDDRLVELGSKEWKIRARPERISAEAARISGYRSDEKRHSGRSGTPPLETGEHTRHTSGAPPTRA